MFAKTCEARLAAVRSMLNLHASCCLPAGTLEAQERSICMETGARLDSVGANIDSDTLCTVTVADIYHLISESMKFSTLRACSLILSAVFLN